MRSDTIKSSQRISQIFNEGRKRSNRFLTLIVADRVDLVEEESVPEHGRDGRVAFIAGKRNGNACWRNAAKRRMREIVRQLEGPWPGIDVLVIAKKEMTEAPYVEVLAAAQKTLERSLKENKR